MYRVLPAAAAAVRHGWRSKSGLRTAGVRDPRRGGACAPRLTLATHHTSRKSTRARRAPPGELLSQAGSPKAAEDVQYEVRLFPPSGGYLSSRRSIRIEHGVEK